MCKPAGIVSPALCATRNGMPRAVNSRRHAACGESALFPIGSLERPVVYRGLLRRAVFIVVYRRSDIDVREIIFRDRDIIACEIAS